MNRNLANILEECIRELQGGESLESLLERYPDQAHDLRPLLEAVVLASSGKKTEVAPVLLARNRKKVLDQAAGLRSGDRSRRSGPALWRRVLITACVIAILAMSGNGLLTASAHSLPGDTLYPLKLSVEATQLQLVNNPDQKKDLEQTFNLRRVAETKSLISIHREEDVEFGGLITSIQPDGWTVSNIPIVVTAHTQIATGLTVGDEVDVHGLTNVQGNVEATSLNSSTGTSQSENDWVPTQTGTRSEDGSHVGFTPTPGGSSGPTRSGGEHEGGSWSTRTPSTSGTTTPQGTPNPEGGDH
jgi:hypothetical protein